MDVADTPMPDGAPAVTLADSTGSRMDRFRRYVMERNGNELHDSQSLQAWAVEHPAEYWEAVWDFTGVVGLKGDVVVEADELSDGVVFPKAQLNLAENVLRYVSERDDAELPLVIATAETGSGTAVVDQWSREDMAALVAATAAALRHRGVGPGDHVVLVLPVSVQAYVVMLAVLSIGAVIASASPQLEVSELVDRFGQLDPVMLVAATSYRWADMRHDRRDALVELAQSLPNLRSLLVVPGSDDLASPVDPDVVDVTRIAALIAAGLGRGVRVDDLRDVQRAHEGAPPHFERLARDHPAYLASTPEATGERTHAIRRHGDAVLSHLLTAGMHNDARPGDRLVFDPTAGLAFWDWVASVAAGGATLVLPDGALDQS
jgi:acetoacetyl-CoA synthetase